MKARFEDRDNQGGDSPASLEKRKSKTLPGRQIVVEYSDSVQIIINLAFDLKIYHTSIWLLTEVCSQLTEECKRQGLPVEPVSKIVALKTQNNDYSIDYLLTVPGQSLSFLPKEVVLIPHFGVQRVDPSEVIGLDNFELITQIGKGKYTNIYLVRMKQTGKFYALKQIPKGQLTGKTQKKLMLERDIMINTESPFITKLHFAFQTPEYSYFVMDYAHSGTLESLESKVIQLKENCMRFYAAEVLLALSAMHSKGYVYGLLNKENILINVDGHIMLSDFGGSRVINISEKKESETKDYIPIEELEGTVGKEDDFATDCRALGAFLYEVLHGHVASIEHYTQSLIDLSDLHAKKQLVLSSACKDFIYGMIKKEPTSDPKAIKLCLEHSWFKAMDFRDLQEKNVAAPYIPDPLSIQLVPLGLDISSIEKDAEGNAKQFKERTALKAFTFKGKTVKPEDDNDIEVRKRRTEKFTWGTKKASTVADLDSKIKAQDEDFTVGTEEFGENMMNRAKTLTTNYRIRKAPNNLKAKP